MKVPERAPSPSSRAGGCRILLIEDNVDHQLLERRALMSIAEGTEVVAVAAASEGLEALSASPWDLVVADYRMPGMDGLEFLRTVRARAIGVPVVLVTGLGSERVAVEAIKEGARDYVVKEPNYLELLPSVAARVMAAAETERQLEEARRHLTRSEERYRELVNTIDAIVWESDAQTLQASFVSDRAEAILGHPVSRWYERADFWLEQVHEDDRERALASRSGWLPDEDRREVEYRAVTADGRPVWLRDTVQVVRDDTGQARQLRGLTVDITDRRLADEARLRLIEIIEATPDFVTTADVEGRVGYLNRAARALLGLEEDDALSPVEMTDFVPAWAQTHARDVAISGAIRDGVWTGETALATKDGQEVPVSQVIVAHRGIGGRIEFLSSVARDISERKRFEAQLVRLADHDPLTNLMSRRRFQEELARELQEAQRYGTHGAVLFLDLDDFKDVNDSLGHRAGDELLVSLATLLQARFRKSDLLARLGGDEFAMLLSHTDQQGAQALAGHLLEAIRSHALMVGDQPIGITASIGIALFPEHGVAVEELLVRADVAMYKAKGLGRHCFAVYEADADDRREVDCRRQWEQRIREALEKDLFELHAQPIVELASDQVALYELLLRMRGDGGQLVQPGAFLRTAERFGLIQDIDRWVARRAVRIIADESRAGREICLSVNLSGKSFTDLEFLPMIERELATTGIDPGRLILEITETAAIANTAQAQRFVSTLRSLGCRFALDDFGVGFSSLYHLKHLAVDYLKIDGSFVRDLPRSTVDQHLVRAMVGVARALGQKTIAEFVGDAGTMQILRECGVDYAQGYYIGRPAAAADVLAASGTTAVG